MLNIHDLERRWLRYKIKRYVPIALSSLLFVILSIVGYIYLIPSEKPVPAPTQTDLTKIEVPRERNEVNTTTAQAQPLPAETIHVPQNTNRIVPEQTQEKLVLKPSLRFMDNIEDSLNHYYISDEQPTEYVNAADNTIKDAQSAPYQSTVVEEVTAETEPDTKPEGLSIIKHEDKTDLSDVIRRFKKNKNPTLSLFIAKKYYSLGEYQKSYNYALMTNEIDKDIEESWLIFAKSLVKLGQHELAVATLKSYLSSKNSTTAKTLLSKIESGEFR